MLKKLAVIISVAFSLLLFASLISYVIWFNLTNAQYVKLSPADKSSLAEGTLVPSEILNGQAKYSRQRVTLRGRINTEMVVCERKECPVGDTCCGCPSERNLRIDDAEASLISGYGGQKILTLLDAQGGSFCRRSTTSCDYDCQDWALGGVYDVEGIFLTDTFQVESKTLVKKPNSLDSVKNFFLEIKKRIGGLRTSGSYILQ